ALATPYSRFERLTNESPRLCRGIVTDLWTALRFRDTVAYKNEGRWSPYIRTVPRVERVRLANMNHAMAGVTPY
ncbi:MAG: hypothetical protein ACREA0_10430, partial [bacterium]